MTTARFAQTAILRVFVCVALAAGLAAQPTKCRPVDDGARGRMVEYAHGLFNLPINSPLRISEERVDVKTCYAQITVATSPPANAFHRILFLSPDRRFLTSAVYDTEKAPAPATGSAGGGAAAIGLSGESVELRAWVSLDAPIPPGFDDVIQVGWGFNPPVGVPTGIRTTASGDRDSIAEIHPDSNTPTVHYTVGTSVQNTTAGYIDIPAGAGGSDLSDKSVAVDFGNGVMRRVVVYVEDRRKQE